MADPFIGEIRPFGFNFAPRNWAFCDGQLYPISQNTALFSLLGTIYGGNGQTTFAVPDLAGRVALSSGTGPGLSQRFLGEEDGFETHTLTVNQIPAHSHNLEASSAAGTSVAPEGHVPAVGPRAPYASPGTVAFGESSVQDAGGSAPHNNMMPYLAINYCIALAGVYPPRN